MFGTDTSWYLIINYTFICQQKSGPTLPWKAKTKWNFFKKEEDLKLFLLYLELNLKLFFSRLFNTSEHSNTRQRSGKSQQQVFFSLTCSVSALSVIIQSSVYIKTHHTLGVGSRSTAPTKPCLLTRSLGGGSPTPPAVCLLSCSYVFTAVHRPKGQRSYPITWTSRSIETIK